MSEDQAFNSGRLHAMTCQPVDVMNLILLVVYSSAFIFFIFPTRLPFSYEYRNEKGIYCYARIVHYSRLCFVPGTLLCHKQCDRLRHRKLNLSSTRSLTCSLPLCVCVSLFLSPNIYSAGHTF